MSLRSTHCIFLLIIVVASLGMPQSEANAIQSRLKNPLEGLFWRFVLLALEGMGGIAKRSATMFSQRQPAGARTRPAWARYPRLGLLFVL